jgi:hypothetical protein
MKPVKDFRFSNLLFGRVWIAVLSGSSQPPIYAEVAQHYLEEVSKGVGDG